MPNEFFDFLFIPAGLTNQDYCQKNPNLTNLINVERTLNIIKHYHDLGSFVIFPSTSLVFDGKNPLPEINDIKNPISYYAECKSLVEDELLKYNSRRISIVRFTKVIGYKYPLFSNWIKSLKKNDQIYPFNDLFFSPVSMTHAVNCLIKIIKLKKYGLFHVSACDDISYADACSFFSKELKLNQELIKPKSFREVNEKIFSSKNSALGTKSINSIKLVSPNSNSCLLDFIKNINP